MGDTKEKRERDTLLYYIRGICRGGRKGCVLRKGGKECLREGIAEKNRGFGGKLEGAKRELNGILKRIERELNGN